MTSKMLTRKATSRNADRISVAAEVASHALTGCASLSNHCANNG